MSYQSPTYIELNRNTFALQQYIGEEVGLNVDLEFFADHVTYGFVAKLRTEVWSHKLPPETKSASDQLDVHEWETVWQLWKHNRRSSRVFGWINRKWPAKKTGVTHYLANVSFDMSRERLFPEFNYPSSMGSPVMRVALTEPIWKWSDGSDL